jgi:ATP-dependent metalloprotease
MQYQAEVVNAVLEQIQGIDLQAPVIVIGATNHPERVDPALRRAGRLDRTIEIPYPNSAALSAIFDHYLKPLADAGRLERDVNTKVLGQMCLRRTGADIEFFVRGAMRRARRVGRLVCQADLLAEITGKPRDPGAMPRMTRGEIDNTAVHEAGHALARCLSSTKGADITFVSIVPRADGTLGFVMMAGSEKQSLTRAEYIERIEVALAGRAAEEIRFSSNGITTGASSDLQSATTMILNMITNYGLGPDDSLLWSAHPNAAHFATADSMLSKIYTSIRAKLEQHQSALDAIAAALKSREELTGPEVVAIVQAENVPRMTSAQV